MTEPNAPTPDPTARLRRDAVALFVVDVQEAFEKAIAEYALVAHRSAVLARGFARLGLPVLSTVQYPKGLGPLEADLAAAVGEPPVEKLVFSSAAAEGIAERLDALGVTQVLVCGLEAHVCVAQTTMDLLDRGLAVHLAADAIASRDPANRELALRRLTAAGAVETSSEMALFELLGQAGTPEFRDVQRLILAPEPPVAELGRGRHRR